MIATARSLLAILVGIASISSGLYGSDLASREGAVFVMTNAADKNEIVAYQRAADGTLYKADRFETGGRGSGGVTAEGNLVVSETGVAGAVNGSAVSSHSIVANGTLSAINQSVPTLGAANCWNAVTPDGRWVYVSNAASATISGFAIDKNGALTPIGGTVVGANPEGSTNLDIAISANGRYLYTLNSGAGAIGIFAIQQDGTLVSLGETGDLPKDAGFNGIAAL